MLSPVCRKLAAAWLVTLALNAAAQTAPPEPALRVAVPYLVPWSYYAADCKHTGILMENLRRLSDRAGLRFEGVWMPVDSDTAALNASNIHLTYLNSTFAAPSGWIRLPLDYTADLIAVSQLTREGVPPKSSPRLRVGVRYRQFAEFSGFGNATLVEGDVPTTLANDYLNGRIDVLIGGRETVSFALIQRGVPPNDMQKQIAVLGQIESRAYLSPEGEARFGRLLRDAAVQLNWPRSDRQLRQRFLQPAAARAALSRAQCENTAQEPPAKS